MNRRGNSYHNTPMQSFEASLTKAQLLQYQYATREEANADIFHYIECFYSTMRRNCAQGNRSPLDFAAAFVPCLQKQRKLIYP